MANMIITIICATLASSGIWTIIGKIIDKKSSDNKLLLALAKDRLCCMCSSALEKGFVTEVEYENIVDLYNPYIAKGGNGFGKKLKSEVDKLPMRKE